MKITRITTTIDDLRDEVDLLEENLDRQWQWFHNNPDDEDGIDRHAIFIRTMRRYIAAHDRWYAAENGG